VSVFSDPRVTAASGVNDAYDVDMPDGIWDIVQVEPGSWVAAAPNKVGDFDTTSESYRQWLAALPRFSTAEQAIGSVLQ
jgi:hypothetical protein